MMAEIRPAYAVLMFTFATFLAIVVGTTVDETTVQLDTTENDNVTTGAEFPYDKLRLPGNINPLTYRVYLHPNITDGKFQYTGSVVMLLEVNEETDLIVLHSLQINHIETDLCEAERPHKVIQIIGTVMHKKHQQAIIQLGSKLSPKHRYYLRIFIAAELINGLHGFYRSSYKTAKGEQKYIATTQFEPVGARLAFPCFDEPEFKAKFTIVMVREGIHKTLSNMPIDRTVRRDDGLYVDYFRESVPMSSYLVAFIVSDFVSLTTTSERGVKISVWAPKDKISQAKYAVEIAPTILNYYEKFFRINFPLPKLDLIGVPEFPAGAMENWGLITYRLTALLYDDKESRALDKQRIAWIVAHEIAHQWFGNLVTMKWWNDLWLNEGFATFIMFIGANLVGPTWKMKDQFVTMDVHEALALDSHSHSHPISVKVKDPAEIGALFDTISYKKGSSVIRMMQDFIGERHFVQGLSNYLKVHSYGNAESNDLWESLRRTSRMPIKSIMDTWTLQMGYPVVNVRRDGNKAYLTQQRFISNRDEDENTTSTISDYKWEIPLTFYYQHDQQKKMVWFPKTFADLSLDYNVTLGWLKLNVDEVGYYRVNYDENNWKALATQMRTNHTALSPTDRANLIDDAFHLANINATTQGQALEMTEYLKYETEYVPFDTAIKSLENIGDLLFSRPGYAPYEKYILQQSLPLVKKLGWLDEGSHLDKLLRGIVLQSAVTRGEHEALAEAIEIFTNWRVHQTRIPPNLRPIVYYAGIKYGNKTDWDYMFNQYLNSRYPSEKTLLMNSLAHTSDQDILKKYLDMSLNDEIIKKQDATFLIDDIARNPIGHKMTYDFMLHNWDTLLKRYGSHFAELARLFGSVLGKGKTEHDLAEAKKLFASIKLGGGERAAKQTLANIRSRIKWLADYETVVVDWFNSKV